MEEQKRARRYIDGLGGISNILGVESCITRIRVEVAEISAVDGDALRATGAFGVVTQGGVVQVIVGDIADELVSSMVTILGRPVHEE